MNEVLVDNLRGSMPELLVVLNELRRNRQIRLWLTKFERAGDQHKLVFYYSEVEL